MSRTSLNNILWALSLVCFAAGLYVGMNVHANGGAALWLASVVLALAPFANHRNK